MITRQELPKKMITRQEHPNTYVFYNLTLIRDYLSLLYWTPS